MKRIALLTILLLVWVALVAIEIVLVAAIIESALPLGGAWQAAGNELAILSIPVLGGKFLVFKGKKDLAKLGKVYDEQEEPWDDILLLVPPRKVKIYARIVQFSPLVGCILNVSVTGLRLYAVVALVAFVVMYRFIPGIVMKFCRIQVAWMDVELKLEFYEKKKKEGSG